METESLIEKIQSLPPEKIAEVEDFVDFLRERTRLASPEETKAAGSNKARISMQWVREHRDEYLGKWVALDGDRLLASGDDAKEIYQEARRQGVDCPFITRVVEESEAVWGGWL